MPDFTTFLRDPGACPPCRRPTTSPAFGIPRCRVHVLAFQHLQPAPPLARAVLETSRPHVPWRRDRYLSKHNMDGRMKRELHLHLRRYAQRGVAGALSLAVLLSFPSEAHASFLSPEMEDKMATFLALFVLFVVPVVLIVLF